MKMEKPTRSTVRKAHGSLDYDDPEEGGGGLSAAAQPHRRGVHGRNRPRTEPGLRRLQIYGSTSNSHALRFFGHGSSPENSCRKAQRLLRRAIAGRGAQARARYPTIERERYDCTEIATRRHVLSTQDILFSPLFNQRHKLPQPPTTATHPAATNIHQQQPPSNVAL